MTQQEIFGRIWSSCRAEVTLKLCLGQIVAVELNQACSEEIFLSPAGHTRNNSQTQCGYQSEKTSHHVIRQAECRGVVFGLFDEINQNHARKCVVNIRLSGYAVNATYYWAYCLNGNEDATVGDCCGMETKIQVLRADLSQSGRQSLFQPLACSEKPSWIAHFVCGIRAVEAKPLHLLIPQPTTCPQPDKAQTCGATVCVFMCV